MQTAYFYLILFTSFARECTGLPEKVVVLHSPQPGKRHVFPIEENSKATQVDLNFELQASQTIQSYFGIRLCVDVSQIEAESTDLVVRSCESVETTISASVSLSNEGAYNISVWAVDKEHKMIGSKESTKVLLVPKEEFIPSYEWKPVEEWQSIPSGLEVELPLGHGSVRQARIPNPFEFRFLPSILHLEQDALEYSAIRKRYGFVTVPVGASDTLESIANTISGKAGVPPACVSMKISGLLPGNFKELPVKDLDLFNRVSAGGVEIQYDISSDTCECTLEFPCVLQYERLNACLESSPSNSRRQQQASSQCEQSIRNYSTCASRCSGSSSSRIPPQLPERVASDAGTLPPAVLDCSSMHSSPSGSKHCSCQNCALKVTEKDVLDAKLPAFSLVVEEGKAPAPDLLLGSSRHAALFHQASLAHGRISGQWKKEVVCTHTVTESVWVVPIWSLVNLFHLSQDLLLPIFGTAGTHSLKDVHVYFDVGHAEERSKLSQIIAASTFDSSPLSLLRTLFEPSHLHSVYDLLVPGTTCFNDIQFGLDLSTSGVQYGLLNPPPHSLLPPETHAESISIHEAGKRFSTLLRSQLCLESSKPGITGFDSSNVNVMFINRRSNRKFSNLAALKASVKQIHGVTKVSDVAPERLAFCRQLGLFRSTNVLVCVCGQGCANGAFLTPGASVMVMVMPRGIAGWRWLYFNAVSALGIPVVVHEWDGLLPAVPGNKTDERLFEGWTGEDDEWYRSDDKGVHPERDQEFVGAIDPLEFRATIQRALKLIGKPAVNE